MQPVGSWVISCEVSFTKRVMGLPFVHPPPPYLLQLKINQGCRLSKLLDFVQRYLEFPGKTVFPSKTTGSTGSAVPETSLERVDEQEDESPAPGGP